MSSQALERCRDQALEKRRKCLEEDKWDEYRQIVKNQFTNEDKACKDVMGEILAELPAITAREFKDKMSSLAKDPLHAKQIQAAQQGKLKRKDESEILDREKTLRVFATSKEYSLDILKN